MMFCSKAGTEEDEKDIRYEYNPVAYVVVRIGAMIAYD